MKKSFFLLLISLSLLSCNSDNDQSVNETDSVAFNLKTINTDLQRYYEDMLVSQSYVEFYAAVESFVSKSHYNGPFLSDQDDLYLWLNNNIARTEFPDYNSAINEIEELGAKYESVISENTLFFNEFSNSQSGDFLGIINEDTIQNPLTCDEQCLFTFGDCRTSAHQNYAGSFEALWDYLEVDPGYSISAISQTVVMYVFNLNSCTSQYESCIDGC